MKKSGLQSVPWLVMHICWLKGDYEVGYFFFYFYFFFRSVTSLLFRVFYKICVSKSAIYGFRLSLHFYTICHYVRTCGIIKETCIYASMETSIYASRAGDEVLPFEQFFIAHKTLHLNSLKCPFVVVYSITFQLCIATQLSACYNIQELEWWFWLSLSLHLPVFYIISLTASVHVSPFSCLFSFSTG